MYKPDHFPSRDNEWQPAIRWQTMLWQCERLGLKFENVGTIAKPSIRFGIWSRERLSGAFIDDLVAEINYRYGLLFDLREFNRRFRDDPQLGPIIRKWRGLRPLSYSSLYEYLIIAIVLQNCTVRRSVNMMQALFEHYGLAVKYDGKLLYCFWSPRRFLAHRRKICALKVGYRAKSISASPRNLLQNRWMNSICVTNQRGQREALLGLYGIGPASVDHPWRYFSPL
jgi:3-methyladenine DNA glycosylase/8-oxoguanine DNA glycosylase